MKILLVDNHDLVIDGLARLLKLNGLSSQVKKAHDGESAFALAQTYLPDLIISDYRMPLMNGLQLLVEIKAVGLKCHFLVISMIDEAVIVETLLNHGADGFVNKESTTDEMLYGVSEVLKGNRFLCRITQGLLKKSKNSVDEMFLTRRELQILKLVVDERKNKEIANDLHINVSTVETHKKNIIRKVGVKSSMGLVRYALENQLFD